MATVSLASKKIILLFSTLVAIIETLSQSKLFAWARYSMIIILTFAHRLLSTPVAIVETLPCVISNELEVLVTHVACN